VIELKSTEQLSSAIGLAHRDARNLVVRATGTSRQYRVTNRAKGTQYTVEFFVRHGKRLGHCSCRAGINGRPCKHVAAAAALNVYLAEQGLLDRQTRRAA
jgi:uncharacterized Zn finger protein